MTAIIQGCNSDCLTDAELRASPIDVNIGAFPSSVEVSNDAGNPIPVSGTVSVTEPVTVDGTVAISQVGTDNNVDANITNASLPVTGPLTDTQLRAADVDVNINNASVTVDDGGSSLTVDGSVAVSNFPASQPVTGPLTDTQLRATPVPVDISGSFPSSVEVANDVGNPVPVSGTVSVTEPVTVDAVDLDIRNLTFATDVVDTSGSTVIANQGSAGASPWNVQGTVSVNEPVSIDDNGSSITVDGTVTANAGTGPWPVTDNGGSLTVDDGGGSITVDGSVTAVASGDHTVVGKAADGAPPSGNPVLIAGQDGTNVQSLRADAVGNLGVYPKTFPSAAMADGVSNTNSLALDEAGTGTADPRARNFVFNGTTWDRQRGNTIGTNVVGAAADGAAVSGNPVLVAGQDGTNVQSLATDTAGRLEPAAVNSLSADGVGTFPLVPSANATILQYLVRPLLFNGTNFDRARGNTTGAFVQGPVADGAAVSGNPVLVAGQDGTNAQSLLTDTAGRPSVVGAAAAGTATVGNPVFVAGTDGGLTARGLLTDSSGRQAVVGAAADGAAVAGNPVRVAGKDGSGNTQDIITDTSGVLAVQDNGGSLTVDVGTALPAGTNNIGDIDIESMELSAEVTFQNNAGVGNGTAMAVSGYATVLVHITAGTATIAPEISRDGGTTYFSASAFNQATGAWNTAPTTDGLYFVSVTGCTHVRFRILSGSGCTVKGQASPQTFTPWCVRPNGVSPLDVIVNSALPSGTNNIGDVDIATITAGTTRIGGTYSVNGQIIDENGTVLTVKVAKGLASASGANALIANVASKKIRVLSYFLSNQDTNTELVIIEQNDGTDLEQVVTPNNATGTGGPVHVAAPTGSFLFETAAGQGIQINLTNGRDHWVRINYIEV